MKMTLHDAIGEVKARITAEQVCQRYGIRVNEHHKARCAWHNDERPSMHIYPGDKGVYCFSCGAGGSVVDLCMAIHSEPLRDTVNRLIKDFNLDCEIDGTAGFKTKPREPDYKALYERELAAHAEDMKDTERLIELVLGRQSAAVWACIDDIETRLYDTKHDERRSA